MTSLAESPPNRHGERTQLAEYPPVALSLLDDRTGWRWLSPRPVGVVDWALTSCVVALGIVPVLVLLPVCWVLRRSCGKVRAA